MTRISPHPAADAAAVLTGGVVRTAALLEITQARVAQVLGLSPATVSRMSSGTYTLDANKKEWELAALLVRLFRSLDALIGANDSASRAWLHGENSGLHGRPIELIRHAEGLVRVVQYLDAARGRI
jgi:DNA-binding XRE family transcriptional regulator